MKFKYMAKVIFRLLRMEWSRINVKARKEISRMSTMRIICVFDEKLLRIISRGSWLIDRINQYLLLLFQRYYGLTRPSLRSSQKTNSLEGTIGNNSNNNNDNNNNNNNFVKLAIRIFERGVSFAWTAARRTRFTGRSGDT